MDIIPFICPFSFSPIKFFITDFSASVRTKVFKFCTHLLRVEVYCVKENNNAEIYFAFFFPFLAHLSYAQDELL